MISNSLLRECLSNVPELTRAEFNLTFTIAERIDYLLKKRGISQKELAMKMGKRESEVSRWLTGRHNLTIKTIARISAVLGEPVISIPQ